MQAVDFVNKQYVAVLQVSQQAGQVAGPFYSRPAGNARMQEIAAAVQEGAKAYLNRQYTTIGIAGIVLFLAIGFSAIGWATAIGFLIWPAISA